MAVRWFFFFFFFNDTATTEIYTLSLHDALPISVVQSEYSLWTRDVETTTLAAMRELGVGLVPYSPLGRGFLTGSVTADRLGATDVRGRYPRFAGEGGHANRKITNTVRALAEAKGVAPAQLALAWVHAQSGRLGVPVVPIPGTKRVTWLEQNVAALDVRLTADEMVVLDRLADQ